MDREIVNEFSSEQEKLDNKTGKLLEEIKELYSLQMYYSVVTCCDKITKLNQICSEAFWYKGRALWKQFDTKNALRAVNRAILLKYNFTEALLTKSAILIDLGKYVEAIELAEKVAEIKPDEYKAFYNKGLALKALEKTEKANLAFRQAIKINFDSCNAFEHIKNKIKTVTLTKERISKIINTFIKDLNIFSSAIAFSSKTIACTGNLCPEDFFECVEMLIIFNFDTEEFICFHCTNYSEDVTFSPDEKLLAQAVEDNPVRIYNAQTGRLIITLNSLNANISHNEKGIAFSHDGEILASSDYNGHIFLWNCKTGELVKTLSTLFNTKFKKYDYTYFSSDNKTLIAKDNYGIIDSWQL